MADDVAEVVARFGAALREAGVPVGAERCERFARGVMLVRAGTVRGVRECAVATLASSREQAETVARVFDATLGSAGVVTMIDGRLPSSGGHQSSIDQEADTLERAARAAREHAGGASRGERAGHTGTGQTRAGQTRAGATRDGAGGGEYEVGVLASATERLAATDFAELTPGELLQLAGAMRRLTLAVPLRRSRRQRRGPRGRRADLRSTLRHARRTGAEPFGIIRKNPARRPRKLVVLCDISGSMEPYARAMLQLLYCAAGGARAEVFSFATRLTRLTGTLAQPRPALALRRAGQAAPDWLGGTRIGPCLKDFNDAFGCRGLARGAVVVVVSDGWDTGDPAVLRREMARLSRVAFRIVWVNPRARRPGYQPLAGGMAAAWPYCDAVVSARRLDALGELTAALADPVRRRGLGRPRPGGGGQGGALVAPGQA
ncbi:MAG TPA: VWA domain-containing protein [Streptosporangiaceae bacterium]